MLYRLSRHNHTTRWHSNSDSNNNNAISQVSNAPHAPILCAKLDVLIRGAKGGVGGQGRGGGVKVSWLTV